MIMAAKNNAQGVACTLHNENGTGAPVVFIHGAGGQKESWSAVARRFAALRPDRPLALLDLPGHGDAAPPGRDCVDDYAADVRAFLKERGWPKFDLAGHSMGGAIVQALAAARPDRVRRVALIGTGARFPVNPLLIDLLPAQFPLVLEMYPKIAFGPDAPPALIEQVLAPFRRQDPQVLRDDFIACRDYEVRDRLAAIEAPCLICVGEKDLLMPVKFSKFLAEHLKRAELEIFPNAGHMLPVERHRELAERLAVFLED